MIIGYLDPWGNLKKWHPQNVNKLSKLHTQPFLAELPSQKKLRRQEALMN